VPIYRSQDNGVTVEPWYFVMQNGNASAATNITWIAGVEAVYVGITATVPTPDYGGIRASYS